MIKEIENNQRTESYLFPTEFADLRIQQEKESAIRLKKRKDFLGRYNYLIRLMVIFYLKQGYDVKNEAIHKALRNYISDRLGLGETNSNLVIYTRHNLKYN
ncbi:MAG: hypothetical protein RIT43_1095, partial [Bacteroidota bacterium]